MVYIVYSLWFTLPYSNGFMVFLAYPSWFIWLISNGLNGLFPMVYGLYVNGIMIYSSWIYMFHGVNDIVGFIK